MKKKILAVFVAAVILYPAPQAAAAVHNQMEPWDIVETGGLKQPEAAALDDEAVDAAGLEEFQVSGKNASVYASPWDSYSTNYYYNMLEEKEQKFWDMLDLVCLAYLTGTEDAQSVQTGAGQKYMTASVRYDDNLSLKEAAKLCTLFRYCNPQYYFLDIGVYYNSGKIMLGIYDAFAFGTSRAAETARFAAGIQAMAAQVNAQGSDVEKERKAHDLILEKTAYGSDTYDQSAYSVFCRNRSVCAGYAQAFQLLCNGAGIDTAVQTSTTHEWNLIRLNDSWYQVDCTWDDNMLEAGRGNGFSYYRYFNRSEAMMAGMLDQKGSHIAEDFWKGMETACTRDSGAAGTNPGSVFVPSETVRPPVFSVSGETVALSAQAGASIYYTTDGTKPSPASGRSRRYKKEFDTEDAYRIRAVAVKDTYWDSQAVQMGIYTVKFESNGGSAVPEQRITVGNFIVKPGDPVKAGHIFGGWYQDPSCTLPFDFTGVCQDLILYAKWTPFSYHVSFLSGGEVLFSQRVPYAGLAKVPGKPGQKGYTFEGWYQDKALKTPYNFASPVKSDLILYAKWKANQYKVTLDANRGYIKKAGTKKKTIRVTYKMKFTQLLEPKRKGYVFTGWYTKKSGGSRRDSTDTVTITKDTALYARWSKPSPKKAAISALRSSKAGSLTVGIREIRSATGYQIRYSLDFSMKSSKIVTTASKQKTIGSLKKGKKYYVQVRMYQKESVSGKKYYGDWSRIKPVKIKK